MEILPRMSLSAATVLKIIRYLNLTILLIAPFASQAQLTNFLYLHSFQTNDGYHPYGWIIEGGDGIIYGTTYYGGNWNKGTIYKIRKDGSDWSVLHHFSGTNDGANVYSGLLEGNDGLLYGTAYSSPANIFKLNKEGTAFTVLHWFPTSESTMPIAGLMEGSDGMLYGSASHGGPFGAGYLFKINKDGTEFTNFWTFDGTNGNGPYAAFLEGPDNMLYGSVAFSASNKGVIFKIAKDGGNFTPLHIFQGPDGATPRAPLIIGNDGLLYGVAREGGSNNVGLIFKMDLEGNNFQILHQFTGADGSCPRARLLIGQDGALYGTAQETSPLMTTGVGSVFKINQDGTGFAVLHYFAHDDGGRGGFLLASDGAFYGTTQYGGGLNIGAVYRLGHTARLTKNELGVRLTMIGIPGYQYRCESSTDLIHWTNIFSFSPGEIEFSTNQNMLSSGAAFYCIKAN